MNLIWNRFQVRARAAKVIFVCCFRDPATWFTFTRTRLVFATKHLKFDNRYSYKGAKGLSCWHVFDQRVSLTIPGLYGESRPKKRYLFQASGLWIKGRISLVEVYKTVGKSVIWVCGLKQLKDEFYCFKMPKNVLFLWLIPAWKTVHLQQVKEMQSSKQGMWKEYHLTIEDKRKEYLFFEKWYIKG